MGLFNLHTQHALTVDTRKCCDSMINLVFYEVYILN